MPERPHTEIGWRSRFGERIGKYLRAGVGNHSIWWIVAVVLLAALVILVLWKVPQWQVGHVEGLTSKEWFDRVNEARKTLATALAGLVVLGGAYFTWRNIKLVQEGQITDRFTKAIEQLGAIDPHGSALGKYRKSSIWRVADQSARHTLRHTSIKATALFVS